MSLMMSVIWTIPFVFDQLHKVFQELLFWMWVQSYVLGFSRTFSLVCLPFVHVILDVGPIDHALKILYGVRSTLIYILASLWVFYLVPVSHHCILSFHFPNHVHLNHFQITLGGDVVSEKHSLNSSVTDFSFDFDSFYLGNHHLMIMLLLRHGLIFHPLWNCPVLSFLCL